VSTAQTAFLLQRGHIVIIDFVKGTKYVWSILFGIRICYLSQMYLISTKQRSWCGFSNDVTDGN